MEKENMTAFEAFRNTYIQEGINIAKANNIQNLAKYLVNHSNNQITMEQALKEAEDILTNESDKK